MDKKTCHACRTEIESNALRCPHCRARQADAPRMHRNVPGRMLAGVCAALAHELQVDVTLVRVAFAVVCLISGGLAFGAYVVIWALTPYEAGGRAPMTRALDWMEGLLGSSSTPRPGEDERAHP